MHKTSLGGRSSTNPVRISLIDKEERRKTQTLKSRTGSGSEETHIPRPRVRSSSVDANGRKSSLKPPGNRLLYTNYVSVILWEPRCYLNFVFVLYTIHFSISIFCQSINSKSPALSTWVQHSSSKCGYPYQQSGRQYRQIALLGVREYLESKIAVRREGE